MKVKAPAPRGPKSLDFICVFGRFEQYRADPVNCEAEKVHRSFGSAQPDACGVLNRDGVYYAMLMLEGQDAPMEVALHGVRSETEARQALASFGARHGAECCLAL